MNKLFIPILFSLIVWLISCEKSENTMPKGVYLNKVYYHKNVDQVREFKYNNRGELIKRTYKFNEVIGEVFEYIRDGELKSIQYYSTASNTDLTLVYRNKIDYYYENGQMVKVELVEQNEKFQVSYTYNSMGRIHKVNYTGISFGSGDLLDVEEYLEYDVNGNINHLKDYRNGVLYSEYLYEYDNEINPYYQLDPINNSYSKLDLISYTCPNNIKKKYYVMNNDTLSVTEYFYEYNEKDYPTFSYESYTSQLGNNDSDSTDTKFYEYVLY